MLGERSPREGPLPEGTQWVGNGQEAYTHDPVGGGILCCCSFFFFFFFSFSEDDITEMTFSIETHTLQAGIGIYGGMVW